MHEKLRIMKGFRNLVVHRYDRMNDEIAFAILQENLGDFALFKEAIEASSLFFVGSLKQVRRGYRGAGRRGSRMTEMINPCSREQPERRFIRIGVYLLWQPRSIPAPPVLYLRPPVQPPCEAPADGDGAVGERLITRY